MDDHMLTYDLRFCCVFFFKQKTAYEMLRSLVGSEMCIRDSVWRDGQKKKVFLYRLLCTGSIEEKVYQRQVSKQGLSANVVDMQDDSKQHFTTDELKALFIYRPDTILSLIHI
eukprot:TRINITY_DN62931_c0_g1_i1.p1 TRINITY_DN62931_c0_g1~~TRINITY_DN62931_c0_g1_i1.p1  ORF type:complete len:113 (-),score=24.29 TRINITY_DN62931_c0_g1_i1:120-458(-)